MSHKGVGQREVNNLTWHSACHILPKADIEDAGGIRGLMWEAGGTEDGNVKASVRAVEQSAEL